MNKQLIYLASPYMGTWYQRELRFLQCARVAGFLISQGNYVFSPITHTHPIARVCDLPGGWDYWGGYDRRMIKSCDELMVLTIDGWAESTGVTAELKIAQELGKPISYIDYVLLQITPNP